MILIESKTVPYIQTGTTEFNNERTKNILFKCPFTKIPAVTLTLDNEDNSPPYKINVLLTGFTIKTKSNYTGSITWQATEN